MSLYKSKSLKNLNTWLVGGDAEYFSQPESIDQLKEALAFSVQKNIPVTILGLGSNVLVSDEGVRGLVVCTRGLAKMSVIESSEKLIIEAECGVLKAELLKIFLKYRLAPALFLAGIPGNVGGGIVMNAGVAESYRPREFVEIIDWIEVLSPDGKKIKKMTKEELQWSYRHCHGWEPGVIIRCGLSWENKPDDSTLAKVREANHIRLSKQPLDMPSCGSVFKNPDGKKAAQLIDQCGLKGYTVGGAQVSMKHANFIVNTGSATARDIDQIIHFVQDSVLKKTSVLLQTEVVKMGKWDS